VITVRTEGFKQDGTKVCAFKRAILLPLRPVGNSGEQP